MISTRRIGHQKHYQANAASPRYSELRNIVLKTVALAEPLRDALKPLAKAIRAAFVYGSVAKAVAKEPSDAQEFAGLVRSALARLKDAENEANSLDKEASVARTYRMVNWLCGTAAAIGCAATLATAQSQPANVTDGFEGQEADRGPSGKVCRATGQLCSLGIDPDVYQMPLLGEFIQSGERLICATRNWSTEPPEIFGIGFMRAFWSLLTPPNQAAAEAAAFFFVTTHWGPPNAPAADLSDVATPAAFPDEIFSSLEKRTVRIEFEVPKTDFERLGWSPAYLPVSLPPDPAPHVPHKLRGWYIKGDGVAADDEHGDGERSRASNRTVEHPLIIVSSGFPYSIAFDEPVGGIAVGPQMRKTVTYLVAQGYDVLFFDKRGHGYSEGLLDGMGEDIFRALDLLEHGVILEDGITLSLSIITSDGRRLHGAAAAAEKLLGDRYTARTKPVILRGFSYGSSQLQKAMAMNYSNFPVEYRFTRDGSGRIVVDHSRTPPGNRGYNFKGIVAISGFQGSIKYETIPYFLALDALASTIGHNGAVLKASVYESMDRWPGFLGLYATNDFETADGGVDAYNHRLRGFKQIRMVTGYHFGLASEAVDSYFAYESARFARQVVFEPPPTDNTRTTTYAREVCNAEPVVMDPASQSIVDVPSRTIQRANEMVDDFIARWVMREHGSRE